MAINAFYITINKMNMKQFVRSGLEIGRTDIVFVCQEKAFMYKSHLDGEGEGGWPMRAVSEMVLPPPLILSYLSKLTIWRLIWGRERIFPPISGHSM